MSTRSRHRGGAAPANTIQFARTLEALLQSRSHGASTIARFRYQILYSLLRAFDLYDDATFDAVRFEGIEDVDLLDLKGLWLGDIHLQVKSSQSDQGWNWINREKVLDHFLEVHREDPRARFVLVTNCGFRGQLGELEAFCDGRLATLTPGLRRSLDEIAARVGVPGLDVSRFLAQVSFERIAEQEAVARLRAATVRHFALTAGNETLYLSRLFDRAVGWATERAAIGRRELEAERLQIDDWVGLGTENPAVRDRLVQPLAFDDQLPGEEPAGYYEGRRARPAHIAAALDAPRLAQQRAIEDTLRGEKVCVIRASSGQGKSTLLYRYALDHALPGTVYRLRTCAREEHIGPVVEYLRNRLALGLPVLLLVDNLGYGTRLWGAVAEELADEDVRILVTTREEDWFRYGGGAAVPERCFIRPQLTLQEARDIFRYFRERGATAPGVRGAEWAFELVAERRLLIEFVYLITHGRMLAERIEEQLAAIRDPDRGEDPAKLDALRLVAAAQVYGARVPAGALLAGVQFRQDPQSTLRALDHEFLEWNDGECEGLHLVRSEHLVSSLHGPLPIGHTLGRLLRLLDDRNLIPLVSNAFADPVVGDDGLIAALIERCRSEPPSLIVAVVDALFAACESRYFQAHRTLFDEAVALVGSSAVLLLSSSTLPSGDAGALAGLQAAAPDNPNLMALAELVSRFRCREEAGSHAALRTFLQALEDSLRPSGQGSLADTANLGHWYRALGVPAPHLDDFLAGVEWEEGVFTAGGDEGSLLLHTLHSRLPARYRAFVESHRDELLGRFKRRFDALTVELRDLDLRVEFVVDEAEGAEAPNAQAVARLQHARRWFPDRARYLSQGFYPSVGGVPQGLDDSRKELRAETLDLMLHAPRNAVYTRLVEDAYRPRLLAEWAENWRALRYATLRVAEAIVALYEAAYRGQQIDVSPFQTCLQEVAPLYRHSHGLPPRFAHRFATQERDLRRWSSSMYNFLGQFAEHDPTDRQSRLSFLLRLNLKEGIQRLPSLHGAFAAIAASEGDYIAMMALDRREAVVYPHLADLLDYWYDHWLASRRERLGRPRDTSRRWREGQRRAFADQVRQGLAPLAADGMRLHYPVAPLDEPPLTSLCLGWDVQDCGTWQTTQWPIIALAVASLPLTYDFLYLVPVIAGHRWRSHVVRIGRETLQRLARGEQVQDGIYPVTPPGGLAAVLPDLTIALLPDVQLVEDYERIVGALTRARNALHFALRLHPENADEVELLAQYRRTSATCAAEQSEAFRQLLAQATEYHAAAARQEWGELWEGASNYIGALGDLRTVAPDLATPTAVQAALGTLERRFTRYMNRRYLDPANSP